MKPLNTFLLSLNSQGSNFIATVRASSLPLAIHVAATGLREKGYRVHVDMTETDAVYFAGWVTEEMNDEEMPYSSREKAEQFTGKPVWSKTHYIQVAPSQMYEF